jgi:hypothetical protein
VGEDQEQNSEQVSHPESLREDSWKKPPGLANHKGIIGGDRRIGLYVLLVVAAVWVIGGIFVVDPVTIRGPEEMTTHGTLHNVAGTITVPGLPVAGLLISRSLRRTSRQREGAVGVGPNGQRGFSFGRS